MWKEATICVVIIVVIIVGNCITQNYTKQTIGELNRKLEELKREILKSENNIESRKCEK